LLAACGLRLAVVRLQLGVGGPPAPELDNQWVTLALADPVSGLAPPEWESNVGEVLLLREDGPLSPAHVELLWRWLSLLAEACAREGPSAGLGRCTRAGFAAFLAGAYADGSARGLSF